MKKSKIIIRDKILIKVATDEINEIISLLTTLNDGDTLTLKSGKHEVTLKKIDEK